MPTYSELLAEAKNLTVPEQRQLLKELSLLVTQQENSQPQNQIPELSKQDRNKWRGFLPQRVDALEFQLELRREWDE